MTTTVDDLLASYRKAATTERDKGTYFERLFSAFLTADPVQGEQYEQVWHWATCTSTMKPQSPTRW